MELPRVGEVIFVKAKRGRDKLRVVAIKKNLNGALIVEYEGPGDMMGACIPEYWWKKVKRDRQAGSGAVS